MAGSVIDATGPTVPSAWLIGIESPATFRPSAVSAQVSGAPASAVDP